MTADDQITDMILATTNAGLFDDLAPNKLESARLALESLWNDAQNLPDEESRVLVSQAIVTCFDQAKSMQQIASLQAALFKDAAEVFKGVIDELRSQRDLALNDLDSSIRNSINTAMNAVATDLAIELDIPQADAFRALEALTGNSGNGDIGYIDEGLKMDARDALRRLADEIFEMQVMESAEGVRDALFRMAEEITEMNVVDSADLDS